MEPLSIEEIKKIARAYTHLALIRSLILTWAHERAEKFELEHRINNHNGEVCDSYIGPREWLVYVLDEIGWDKKEMG